VGHLRLPLPREGAGVQFIRWPFEAGVHTHSLRQVCPPGSAGAPIMGTSTVGVLVIPSRRL